MSFIERFIIQCPYYRRSIIGGSNVDDKDTCTSGYIVTRKNL